MSGIKDLYELQSLDLTLDQTRERLHQIRLSIGKDEEITLLKRELTRQKENQQEAIKNQDRLDIGISEFDTHINQVESKMYSGNVINPRELEDLQAELGQIRRQKVTVEEQLLSILENLDELAVQLSNIENTLFLRERQWHADQDDLIKEKGVLDQSLIFLSEQRETLATGISAIELALYNRVRTHHKGKAVAKVDRDTCEACRTGIPTVQIQALRSAVAPVRCDNCGLILFRE